MSNYVQFLGKIAAGFVLLWTVVDYQGLCLRRIRDRFVSRHLAIRMGDRLLEEIVATAALDNVELLPIGYDSDQILIGELSRSINLRIANHGYEEDHSQPHTVRIQGLILEKSLCPPGKANLTMRFIAHRIGHSSPVFDRTWEVRADAVQLAHEIQQIPTISVPDFLHPLLGSQITLETTSCLMLASGLGLVILFTRSRFPRMQQLCLTGLYCLALGYVGMTRSVESAWVTYWTWNILLAASVTQWDSAAPASHSESPSEKNAETEFDILEHNRTAPLHETAFTAESMSVE